jgi:hypothetical protein
MGAAMSTKNFRLQPEHLKFPAVMCGVCGVCVRTVRSFDSDLRRGVLFSSVERDKTRTLSHRDVYFEMSTCWVRCHPREPAIQVAYIPESQLRRYGINQTGQIKSLVLLAITIDTGMF